MTMKWSKLQTEIFLSVLSRTGNVSAAARAAKVSRNSAYERRKKHREFQRLWHSALEESLDDLEEALRIRALNGIDKPVYFGGKQVGDIKSYNDNLGMFLLKSRRPEIFGDGDIPISSDKENETQDTRTRLLEKLESMAGNDLTETEEV